MKELKRFLALFLCLTMLFTAVPVQVFATEAESDEPVVTEPVVEEETPAPEETEAPAVEETDPPVVEETEAPAVEETEAPVEETEAPVEETEAPVEETEAPAEEPTLPEQIEEPAPDADASVESEADTQEVADTDVAKIGDTGYATLADAVAAAVDGDTIVILQNLNIDTVIAVKTDVTITAENAVTLTRASTNDIFDVNAGATLTLSGPVTLVGNTQYGTMVDVLKSGTFIMNDGVTIRDNMTAKTNIGAAVTVSEGTFIMNGGTIENCGKTATSNLSSASAYHVGGAVRVYAPNNSSVGASFTMNGGTIKDCFCYYGGAIGLVNMGSKAPVTVTINGGSIISNAASTGDAANGSAKGHGGAIYIYNSLTKGMKSVDAAVVTINGGSITENTANKYGTLGMYTGSSGNSWGGKYNIFGGVIKDNFVGSGSNNAPGSFYGNGIYLPYLTSTNEVLLTIGGTAVIENEVHVTNKTGNHFEIRDDFTGSVKIYSQAGGTGATPSYGTLVAKQVNSDGEASDATKAIAGRIIAVYGQGLDADGNVYEHPVYDIVLGTNPDEYVLGAYPVYYTVTYTDGVEGGEVFADQSYTVEEGTATPAFEGTPARVGYIFGGWTPEIAETVTADVTYTAIWNECEHTWGEPVFDETVSACVSTCTNCGATESTPVVAKLESTGTYYPTLQEAIDAANTALAGDLEADKITLVNNTTECVTLAWLRTNGDMTLTVDLNGYTVTGDGTATVMTFSGPTSGNGKFHIVIEDSSEAKTGTVTGGNATSGGAIKMDNAKSGDSLTINGGNFVNNTASSDGGALYSAVVGAKITVNGGTFTGNTAKSGGAISAHTLEINGGVITGNSATGDATFTGRGGAISMWGPYALSLEINGGQIYGNTATRYGDDIVFCSTNKTTASMNLCKPANGGKWYVDGYYGAFGSEANLTARHDVENPVEFADYADFSGKDAMGIAVALKLDTIVPAAPTQFGENVTPALVRVICDSDPDRHAPMDIKWQHQSTKVYPGASVEWDAELNTWKIKVRIDSISTYYVWMNFEEVYNEISHDLVPDAPIPEGKYHIDTYLKWDDESKLWVTLDEKPIDVHTTCKTAPTAPEAIQLSHYQIQVMADLDGDGVYGENGLTNESGIYELYTTSIPAEYYKDLVVKGSREEGFTVDITVTLEDGDIFITNWIKNRAPGESFGYIWSKTEKTVSFTLKYTGDLTGNLYGTQSGDWVLSTTGEYFGKVGEAFVGKVVNVTYTDGVEGVELFADQVIEVVTGENTPAFNGEPTREGYDFAGWTPEVSETVTGETTYTATWTPAAPKQANVTKELVAIICDSDPDRHATVYGKWYPLGHCETTSDIVWNEELATWTVDVRIGSLYIMYVDQLEDANNGTMHELVEDITTVYATLKWDAEKLMWFPTEPIELHTTCQTAPTAPTYKQLDSYQIKVYGYVDGEEKVYTTNIPENGYTVGEVKGSREEGFTVDITVTLEDGDAYITNWIAQRNPGKTYFYDWDKTEKTVTFTLTYNGDLNGTLYGHRHAANTNYDWIIGFNHNNSPVTYGVVGEAYIKQQVVVTYTDGIENAEIFADETYTVFVGEQTPAFQGNVQRNGYTFLGWTPEVTETVTGEVTYVAQWVEQEPVYVYTVMGGDPQTTELLFSGRANNGENLVAWLNANVEIPVKKGYAPESWFYLNEFGTKVSEDAVVDVWNTVYINYTVCTHTWGEPVLDTENMTHTYTCEICSETRVEKVVARIESNDAYYESLDEALEAANLLLKEGGSTAETVTLVADTTECVNVTWSAAAVSTVTIDLNGHTVTGDGTGAVFYFMKAAGAAAKDISIVIKDSVGTGKVTKGVGYTNKTSTYGGAIYINSSLGGTLTIEGGTFTGNTAALGGAVHSVSTDVIINGGTFTNNSAKTGGAIYASDLTINDGVITGNTATGEVDETSTSKATAGGGGIAVRGSEVHLTINRGKIYGNTAAAWGDDILYIHTNARDNSDMKLIDAADPFDGWYVDGLNGVYGKGRTDRFGENFIAAYTDLSVDKNEAKNLVLGLKAACTYSVTYTDGVEGEEVFADQVILAVPGSATPAFDGTPVRGCYTFTGWTPEVAETVTADVTYTAQWQLSHTPGEAVIENEVKATCTKEGSYDLVVYCSECEEELSRETKTVEKLAHTPAEAVKENEVEATCTKEGSYDLVVYCSECEAELSRKTKTVEKLAHTPAEAVKENEVEATCTKEGSYDLVVYCSECEAELSRETKTTEKLAHEYKDGKCEDCGEEDPDYVAPSKNEVIRISGSNRIETAFKVANELKDVLGIEKFDTILLASGDNFADALAGSYLAVLKNAPVLLYRANAMQQNADYISKNLAAGGTVYILGGTASVPQEMEDTLTEAGITVKRLAGSNRYNTNLEILKETGVTGGEILVATGLNYADSLSASATGKPILMVNSDANKLTDAQIAFLSKLSGVKFTIIGGTASVSEELAAALEAYGTVDRVAGSSRERTSVAVAERYFTDPDWVVVAYSRNYPDGLCAGPLAYAMGAPLLLTNAGAEKVAAAYVETNGITNGLIVGGPASVTDDTVRIIFQMDADDEIVAK